MGDLRVSIGGFFTLAGVIVTITGIASKARAPLDTIDLNLYSGLVLFAFGVVMLWLARRPS